MDNLISPALREKIRETEKFKFDSQSENGSSEELDHLEVSLIRRVLQCAVSLYNEWAIRNPIRVNIRSSGVHRELRGILYNKIRTELGNCAGKAKILEDVYSYFSHMRVDNIYVVFKENGSLSQFLIENSYFRSYNASLLSEASKGVDCNVRSDSSYSGGTSLDPIVRAISRLKNIT